MNLAQRVANLSPEKRRLLERLTKTPRIERAEEPEAPLTFEQERMWFLHQLDPKDSSYHLHMHLPLERDLSLGAWTNAWRYVIERQSSLRTRFPLRDGLPVQVVDAPALESIPVHSLTDLSPHERRAEATRLAREQAEIPFDLAHGPVLRLCLLEFPEQWVQLITVHHIAADGWSIDVLMRDLTAAYSALRQQVPVAIPPLKIQYADFARWQRSQLTGGALDELLSFWSTYLEGAPPLMLPLDRPRPENHSYRGGVRARPLPARLVSALEELARREGSTLFQVLLAAFAILLHRYSGQRDLVFGTPVANRELPEVEDLVGFFLNTIVLRVRLEPEQCFTEVLAAVRESTVGAYSHQQLPFAVLVQHLQPQRDLRRNPLYQATIQMLRSRHARARTDVHLEEVGYERTATNADLAFDLLANATEILCRVEYRLDIFDDATIERLLDHWERLLDAIVTQPDLAIGVLQLTTAEERNVLLEEWAGSSAPPRAPWIFQGDSDRPAIHHERGVISYRELDNLVGRLAAVLQEQGACEGDVVAIELEDAVETIVAILAAWRAGAAYVFIDPALPPQRLQFLRDDASPRVSLTADGAWRRKMAEVAPLMPQPVLANTFAALVYTSGSTGIPKGVIIEHGSLANQVEWLRTTLRLSPRDVVLQKYSFSFDAALSEMLSALSSGAQLLVDGERGRDADRLIALIREAGVTVLDVVPSQLAVLVEHPAWRRCTSLRVVICGGERLSAELAARCAETLSDARLINAYGPTEATITATWWEGRPSSLPPPIGHPIPGNYAFVLDRALQPVPVGMRGELFLGGAGVARGYWKAPEATARQFLANPFGPGRLYATGDCARFRASGELEYLGRDDGQVKLRGFRIETAEIERALEKHPALREAAVVLRSVAAVPEEEAALWQWRLDQLSPAEAEFLLRFESGDSTLRRQTMWRNTPEFNLYLQIQEPAFAVTPTPAQQNWLLRRTLDEAVDDLRTIDATARRCVGGSARPMMNADWRRGRAEFSSEQLQIHGQQVMQAWERPLMQALAEIAGGTRGDVAEIGFGMGISASMLQEAGVRSHTIVECHPDVLDALARWREHYPNAAIDVVARRWQDWIAAEASFDAILFDTYPTSEEEYAAEVIESPTFAASFFPTASRLLRPGGVFTYYTNEIDSLSRRHQRLLFEHFSSVGVSLVRDLQPPADCQYWWADSMAVVKAIK